MHPRRAPARHLIAVVAVVAALVAAIPAPAAAALPSSGAARRYTERLTLRLADLGPGYVLGEHGCGVIAGEGATRKLTELYLEHRHRGCSADLRELWTPVASPPRAGAIDSAAYRFRDAAGPAALMPHARDVIAYVAGVSPSSLRPLPAPAVGDEAVAFRTDDAYVPGEPGGRPGAIVVWRSERVLALLSVAAPRADVAETAAPLLAAAQQRRIASPTPLRPADTYDAEVPLDDPALAIDVPWLGRELRPGGGLPPLTLTGVDEEAPALGHLRLSYGTEPHADDVSLYLWPRGAWRRHVRTRFGRLVWADRCVHATRVAVDGGRAVIYAGHVRTPKRCGRRRPNRHLAHVFLDDLVISVNPVGCWRCRSWGGPYDSPAGMRAVVRALHPRLTP